MTSTILSVGTVDLCPGATRLSDVDNYEEGLAAGEEGLCTLRKKSSDPLDKVS